MSALGPYVLALVAGVLSFTSPCCLPLMPGYVSYVSGVVGPGTGGVAVRPRVLGAALLFVLGFATVFTLLGAGASSIGGFLLAHRQSLIRVAGLFVALMGLVTMGVVRIPWLSRERCASTSARSAQGLLGPSRSAWRSPWGGPRASAPSWRAS